MGQHQWTASATGPGADFDTLSAHGTINMKVNSPASDCVVALETSPDGTTWTPQDTVTGNNWATAASHFTARHVRPNVSNLGTGGQPLTAVITWN